MMGRNNNEIQKMMEELRKKKRWGLNLMRRMKKTWTAMVFFSSAKLFSLNFDE